MILVDKTSTSFNALLSHVADSSLRWLVHSLIRPTLSHAKAPLNFDEMLYFSCTLTIAVVMARFAAADGPFFNIKSREATGSGCTMDGWVDVKPHWNLSYIEVRYPAFSPEISPLHGLQSAVQECKLVLHLDQMLAGYRFLVSRVDHTGLLRFQESDRWTARLLTGVQYNGAGHVSLVTTRFLCPVRI